MEKSSKTQASSLTVFGRQESLCLKGIAIIMLICHHCFMRPSRYKGQDLIFIIPEPIWNYVALFFKICVCIFVFISAYGITSKIKNSSVSEDQLPLYVRNVIISRLIRLLGGFIFVFLLVDLFGFFMIPDVLQKFMELHFPVLWNIFS